MNPRTSQRIQIINPNLKKHLNSLDRVLDADSVFRKVLVFWSILGLLAHTNVMLLEYFMSLSTRLDLTRKTPRDSPKISSFQIRHKRRLSITYLLQPT